jgi:NTE family protein
LKLGIALSGGGIRGIAHAGVLKALDENGIKIDAIGGTSSGSLIASLYAMRLFTILYIHIV